MKLNRPVTADKHNDINERTAPYQVPEKVKIFLEMFPNPYNCFTCCYFQNPVCLRFEQIPPYSWAEKCGACKYWRGDDGLPF